MFRVGQRVVCVETWHLNGKGRGDERGPIKGSIYTIRAIGVGINPRFPDTLQVRLAEIINPTREYCYNFLEVVSLEVTFAARRFRPIASRPTSIEFAHEILRKVNAPGRVTA